MNLDGDPSSTRGAWDCCAVLSEGRTMTIDDTNYKFRLRATRAEMHERAEFLIDYAVQHEPVTVRQLFYQAVVAGLPGITKEENGYNKVQAQVLSLRREGLMPYGCIADMSRLRRHGASYKNIHHAMLDVARSYKKALWVDNPDYVEVWCEKDALAGVILPVTIEYDVPLMVSHGFASETYCYEAIEAAPPGKRYVVYHLGDFDRSGQDAAADIKAKLERFGEQYKDFEVEFRQIAVTQRQITQWSLPTRQPKMNSPADRKWPHNFACELDAIAPDDLRTIVRDAIEQHLPRQVLEVMKEIEESERMSLVDLATVADCDAAGDGSSIAQFIEWANEYSKQNPLTKEA
jgi:hypothetical protein